MTRGSHEAGEVQGQTRQHSRHIDLLGAQYTCIGADNMGCDMAAHTQ